MQSQSIVSCCDTSKSVVKSNYWLSIRKQHVVCVLNFLLKKKLGDITIFAKIKRIAWNITRRLNVSYTQTNLLLSHIHISIIFSILGLENYYNSHQPFFCLDKILPVHLMSIVNSRTFTSILHVIEE